MKLPKAFCLGGGISVKRNHEISGRVLPPASRLSFVSCWFCWQALCNASCKFRAVLDAATDIVLPASTSVALDNFTLHILLLCLLLIVIADLLFATRAMSVCRLRTAASTTAIALHVSMGQKEKRKMVRQMDHLQ